MSRRRQVQPTNLQRDPSTFEPFIDLPSQMRGVLDPWLRATRIIPVSAIEWKCNESWTQPPRRLRDSIWYWIKEGSGFCRIGDQPREFPLSTGDLFMIPKGNLHETWPAQGGDLKLITVHFFADFYGSVDLTSVLGLSGVFRDGPDANFAKASAWLAREYALKAPGWRRAMEIHIGSVLIDLIRNHSPHVEFPHDGGDYSELGRLQPVFNLIDERLDDPKLKVADLAEAIFVSEVYLRKLFQRTVAISPVAFIRYRRIDNACVLLRTTDQSIKSIAQQCGFTDLAFFYRTFRKTTVTTPLQYRQTTEV